MYNYHMKCVSEQRFSYSKHNNDSMQYGISYVMSHALQQFSTCYTAPITAGEEGQ